MVLHRRTDGLSPASRGVVQRQNPPRSSQCDCRRHSKGKGDTAGLRRKPQQHRAATHSKIKKHTCGAGSRATFIWPCSREDRGEERRRAQCDA